jgi:nitrogen regulatory protein PII 2
MKEVVAIIRMNRMNQTKQALAAAGCNAFHARECLGRGKGLVDFNVLSGVEYDYEEAAARLGGTQRLFPKRMLSIMLPDKMVDRAVKTIIEVNRTGKSGDGKIFVMPVMEGYLIRTGESGDETL